ncbi:hypothetical protein ACWGCW_01105 [Streptomyces sp. NPDC054933]
MLDHGTLVHRYAVTGALGRHQRLDSRSLNWLHHHDHTELKPVRHEIPIPILDQQDLLAQGVQVSELVPGAQDVDALGSCTAQTGTAALAWLLGADRLDEVGLSGTDAVADEQYAIRLYHEATLDDDDLRDEWPPTDCGSSGLGVARALHARGAVGSYVHATSADAFASLLQTGPVMVGMPWTQAFFEPDGEGFIDSGDWMSSGIAGGHEVLAIGLEKVEQDSAGRAIPQQTVMRLRNSWSTNWNPVLSGEFRMRLSTYQVMRSAMDLIQLRGV